MMDSLQGLEDYKQSRVSQAQHIERAQLTAVITIPFHTSSLSSVLVLFFPIGPHKSVPGCPAATTSVSQRSVSPSQKPCQPRAPSPSTPCLLASVPCGEQQSALETLGPACHPEICPAQHAEHFLTPLPILISRFSSPTRAHNCVACAPVHAHRCT